MKNKIQMPVARRTRNVLYSFAVALLSLMSCKDEGALAPDDPVKVDEKAILPAKDQKYTYKVVESDGGEGSSVLKVTSVKDSAGIPVYHIENAFQYANGRPMILNYRAYSKDGLTTHELSAPAGLEALREYIADFATITNSKTSGFPQYQVFDNNATLGSKVTFSKDPIKLHMDLEIPVQNDKIAADIDAVINYDEGKVVKEETITTPAGTFKCSKWAYSYELYTKLTSEYTPDEESTVVYTVTLWTAPGMGIVKSS